MTRIALCATDTAKEEAAHMMVSIAMPIRGCPTLPLAIATTTLAISAAVLAIADVGVTIAAVERTTVANCVVVLRVDP